MMYKKGDIVQIREDLIVGEEYGLCPVKMMFDMKDCRGKTGTVTDINPVEMTVKVGDWWWSEVMVRPVTSTRQSVVMTNWGKLSKMNVDDAAKEITCLISAIIAGFVDRGFLSMHKCDFTINSALDKFIREYLVETEDAE